MPLDKLPFPGMQGRYLNGNADLVISCTNGMLMVQAKQVYVNGQPLPEAFMQGVRAENLAKSAYENPDVAAKLRHVRSVRIDGDYLVIETSPAE